MAQTVHQATTIGLRPERSATRLAEPGHNRTSPRIWLWRFGRLPPGLHGTDHNVLGNGTLGLNLIDDNTIVDADTHNIHLSHAGFTGQDQFPGQVYTVSTPRWPRSRISRWPGRRRPSESDMERQFDGGRRHLIEQWIDGDWQESNGPTPTRKADGHRHLEPERAVAGTR